MPLKSSGEATNWRPIDEFGGGGGWMAYPDEGLQRASHVLTTDAGVFVVDPIDVPGLDTYLAEFGDVVGVTVLMTHHGRDAATIANRHDVPVYLPAWVDIEFEPSVDINRELRVLGDTDYRLLEPVSLPWWREASLFDGETLVVSDSLGTATHFQGGGNRLGIHPLLRLCRPNSLRHLDPERVLVGHGTGIFEDGGIALTQAFDDAWRTLPTAWLNGIKLILGLTD